MPEHYLRRYKLISRSWEHDDAITRTCRELLPNDSYLGKLNLHRSITASHYIPISGQLPQLTIALWRTPYDDDYHCKVPRDQVANATVYSPPSGGAKFWPNQPLRSSSSYCGRLCTDSCSCLDHSKRYPTRQVQWPYRVLLGGRLPKSATRKLGNSPGKYSAALPVNLAPSSYTGHGTQSLIVDMAWIGSRANIRSLSPV